MNLLIDPLIVGCILIAIWSLSGKNQDKTQILGQLGILVVIFQIFVWCLAFFKWIWNSI